MIVSLQTKTLRFDHKIWSHNLRIRQEKTWNLCKRGLPQNISLVTPSSYVRPHDIINYFLRGSCQHLYLLFILSSLYQVCWYQFYLFFIFNLILLYHKRSKIYHVFSIIKIKSSINILIFFFLTYIMMSWRLVRYALNPMNTHILRVGRK